MEMDNDLILDMFIFETRQLIDQLEQIMLFSEKTNSYDSGSINEIFRIMHTIKGSSAMMSYSGLSELAHSMEDLFAFLRENESAEFDYSKLTDMILKGLDFIKDFITAIKEGRDNKLDASSLVNDFNRYLSELKGGKNTFKAIIHFQDDCQMENIRAYTIVYRLEEIAGNIRYFPRNIIEDDSSVDIIREKGFRILFDTSASLDEVRDCLSSTLFIERLEVKKAGKEDIDMFTESMFTEPALTEPMYTESLRPNNPQHMSFGNQPDNVPGEPSFKPGNNLDAKNNFAANSKKTISGAISVSISKLDKLLDSVGELVISEAMVTRNPDIVGLQLENFSKAARHLRKVTREIQDIVMSIRMVPVSMVFMKMYRVTRDMGKKLNKRVNLRITGEETEVDKNIIEHLSDPIMHLIRNAIDHGIETPEERKEKGKAAEGRISLEARNEGGDVWISVRDDGRGIDRDKIIKKARERGIISEHGREYTDSEVYSMLFLPGFSTKDNVSEFSGRGVGLDVVTKGMEEIGGSVHVESKPGEGTAIHMKIPLTLAIINGMVVKVGDSKYIIPTTVIRESFRAAKDRIIKNPEGREMVVARGECLPVVRLHEMFNVSTSITDIEDGIIVIVESSGSSMCLFVDELIEEQQVVIKALPVFIRKLWGKVCRGLGGCALLGDGSVSLILDVAGIISTV